MLATTTVLALALIATPEEAYALLDEVPALVEADDLSGALAKAEQAVAADPENFDAMSIAAALAEKTGDLQRALELQKSILAFDANADEARLAIARLEFVLGNKDAARAMTEELLERHPQSEEALALRKSIRIGKPFEAPASPPESPLKPLVRLDFVTGYDTNPTLLSEEATGGAVGGAQAEDVAITTLDGTVGFFHAGKDRPLTVLGRVRTTRAFDPSPSVQNALASTVGVSGIGRRRLAENVLGIADLRYQALWTDGYGNFIQHFIAPSALASYETGIHQLRALAGLEMRFFDENVSDSVTPRLALRDTIDLGDLMLIFDVGGRLAIDITSADGEFDTDYVGSQELSTLLFGQYELAENFTAFAATDFRWRSFDTRVNGDGEQFDPRETLIQILAGLRYRLDIFELHLEYSYSTAQASVVRAFDRQQITGGVRVWYY